MTRRNKSISWALLGLWAGFSGVRLEGQETSPPVIDPLTAPRPTLEARRSPGPITLDGDLDEEAWASADSTDGVFYQTLPEQGVPSRERTVIRVLYDSDFLYIGAVLHDSEPERLVSAGLELAGEAFDADLWGARLRYAYDTRTFLSAFVQYNPSADELQTNVRFNLIHAPLSDVFLVYSERRDTKPGGGESAVIDRVVTLKVTNLFSL